MGVTVITNKQWETQRQGRSASEKQRMSQVIYSTYLKDVIDDSCYTMAMCDSQLKNEYGLWYEWYM